MQTFLKNIFGPHWVEPMDVEPMDVEGQLCCHKRLSKEEILPVLLPHWTTA